MQSLKLQEKRKHWFDGDFTVVSVVRILCKAEHNFKSRSFNKKIFTRKMTFVALVNVQVMALEKKTFDI